VTHTCFIFALLAGRSERASWPPCAAQLSATHSQ
jgi:hypothetical protein